MLNKIGQARDPASRPPPGAGIALSRMRLNYRVYFYLKPSGSPFFFGIVHKNIYLACKAKLVSRR